MNEKVDAVILRHQRIAHAEKSGDGKESLCCPVAKAWCASAPRIGPLCNLIRTAVRGSGFRRPQTSSSFGRSDRLHSTGMKWYVPFPSLWPHLQGR